MHAQDAHSIRILLKAFYDELDGFFALERVFPLFSIAHIHEDILPATDGDQIVVATVVFKALAVAGLLAVLLFTEVFAIVFVAAALLGHIVIARQDPGGDVPYQVHGFPSVLPILCVPIHVDQVPRVHHVYQVHLIRLIPQEAGHGRIYIRGHVLFRIVVIVSVVLGIAEPGHGLYPILHHISFRYGRLGRCSRRLRRRLYRRVWDEQIRVRGIGTWGLLRRCRRLRR